MSQEGRELVAAPVERAAELVGVVDLAVEDHAHVVTRPRRVGDPGQGRGWRAGTCPHAPRPSTSSLKWSSGPRWTMTSTPRCTPARTEPSHCTSRVDHSDDAAHAGLLAGRGVEAGPLIGAPGLRRSHHRRPRLKRRAILRAPGAPGQPSPAGGNVPGGPTPTSAGTGPRASSMAASSAATMALISAGGTTLPHGPTRSATSPTSVATTDRPHREGLEHRPGQALGSEECSSTSAAS